MDYQRFDKGIKASRVNKSAFSMKCEFYKSINITHPVTGEHNGMLILAHVNVRKGMLAGTVVLTTTTRK